MEVHKVSAFHPFIFQKSGKSTIIRNLAVLFLILCFFLVFVWTQDPTSLLALKIRTPVANTGKLRSIGQMPVNKTPYQRYLSFIPNNLWLPVKKNIILDWQKHHLFEREKQQQRSYHYDLRKPTIFKEFENSFVTYLGYNFNKTSFHLILTLPIHSRHIFARHGWRSDSCDRNLWLAKMVLIVISNIWGYDLMRYKGDNFHILVVRNMMLQ